MSVGRTKSERYGYIGSKYLSTDLQVLLHRHARPAQVVDRHAAIPSDCYHNQATVEEEHLLYRTAVHRCLGRKQ